jgi:hypothetical protein
MKTNEIKDMIEILCIKKQVNELSSTDQFLLKNLVKLQELIEQPPVSWLQKIEKTVKKISSVTQNSPLSNYALTMFIIRDFDDIRDSLTEDEKQIHDEMSDLFGWDKPYGALVMLEMNDKELLLEVDFEEYRKNLD